MIDPVKNVEHGGFGWHAHVPRGHNVVTDVLPSFNNIAFAYEKQGSINQSQLDKSNVHNST